MSNDPSGNNQKTRLSYDDVQALIRETDQLPGQLQYLVQQSQLLSDSVYDLEGSKASLKEIMNRPKGEKMLIPLGSQILVSVILDSKETVLHDLGSNILKDIPIEESIKKIEARIEIFKKSSSTISTQIYQLENMIAQRENLLNQIIPASEANK